MESMLKTCAVEKLEYVSQLTLAPGEMLKTNEQFVVNNGKRPIVVGVNDYIWMEIQGEENGN